MTQTKNFNFCEKYKNAKKKKKFNAKILTVTNFYYYVFNNKYWF